MKKEHEVKRLTKEDVKNLESQKKCINQKQVIGILHHETSNSKDQRKNSYPYTLFKKKADL